MATSSYSRSLSSAFKRLKLSPSTPAIQQARHLHTTSPKDASPAPTSSPDLSSELSSLRLPKAVQATYLAPLRRQPTHNIPCADLQLRSYSVRNLELFADFAMRAAYFLNLPAKGPVPLSRFTERWTVPRSNFVHKKSQENFERRTMRRLIRIVDGEPKTVAIWLAWLKKYQYYGVGMKADVWESSGLEVGKELDGEAERIRKLMESPEEVVKFFEGCGIAGPRTTERVAEKSLIGEPFKKQWGAGAAMSASASVKDARKRVKGVAVEDGKIRQSREPASKEEVKEKNKEAVEASA